MNTPDINEGVKELLAPFLTTDWSILPSEDLDEQMDAMNQREEEIEVTDAAALLWFAKGLHDSIFFLKDYSVDSKIPGVAKLPTEYMGALVVHRHERSILTATWHGFEFLLMDKIKITLGPYPISKADIGFCHQITQALSSG